MRNSGRHLRHCEASFAFPNCDRKERPSAADGASTTVLVTGAAKEGLVKQRSAEKTVGKVIEWLQGSVNAEPA